MASNPCYGVLDLSDSDLNAVIADLDRSAIRRALIQDDKQALYHLFFDDIAAFVGARAANAPQFPTWQERAAHDAGVPLKGEI